MVHARSPWRVRSRTRAAPNDHVLSLPFEARFSYSYPGLAAGTTERQEAASPAKEDAILGMREPVLDPAEAAKLAGATDLLGHVSLLLVSVPGPQSGYGNRRRGELQQRYPNPKGEALVCQAVIAVFADDVAWSAAPEAPARRRPRADAGHAGGRAGSSRQHHPISIPPRASSIQANPTLASARNHSGSGGNGNVWPPMLCVRSLNNSMCPVRTKKLQRGKWLCSPGREAHPVPDRY
ncbi:hypothetical protein ABIB45_004095 [Arthrobacter sp. UYCo732]